MTRNRGETSRFEGGWRQRFISYAKTHDDDASIAGWTRTGLATRLRHFAAHFPRHASGLWLDAGCGAGTYVRYVASLGAQVVGVDYSLPSIQKALERDSSQNLYLVSDVTQLPFPPVTFDGAICFGVTQALPESARAVSSLCSVVKPGASVWIDALNAHCLPNLLSEGLRRLRRQPVRLRYERSAVVEAQMRTAGLVDVSVLWLPIAPGRLQRLQPLLESKPIIALFRVLPGIGALLSHSFVVTGRKPATSASA